MCVLLRSARGEIPPTLARALQRRRVDVREHAHAYSAFADLCREDARGTDVPLILILIEPEHLRDARELVAAVERYATSVIVWIYSERDGGMLREYRRGESETWKGTPTEPEPGMRRDGAASALSGPRWPAGPKLRYVPPEFEDASENPEHDETPHHIRGGGDGDRPQHLTEEELRILFADDDNEND